MKQAAWLKWMIPLVMAGAVATGSALADDAQQPTYGPGYGMMGGGYGPGMMGGRGYPPGGGDDGYAYGPGYGMMGGYGPGMMGGWGGGYGMGYGMMGGYGMGPGMMGGYGMGSGMMGGWGGHGMMLPLWGLKLDDNQRAAIENIMVEQHNANWPLMSSLFVAYGKLRDLYAADNWDAKAIGQVYSDIFKTQQAMIESSIKTHNRIYDQLTKEQKAQLRNNAWGGRWGGWGR